jgi:hypothetical protein
MCRSISRTALRLWFPSSRRPEADRFQSGSSCGLSCSLRDSYGRSVTERATMANRSRAGAATPPRGCGDAAIGFGRGLSMGC